MDRFVYDQNSGVYLLFPDKARLHTIVESIDDGRIYISVGISLSTWGDEPSAPTPNREIVLTNETFVVTRPIDQKLHSFRFVKKEALTGAITMVCDALDWAEIKKLITIEPDYLKITYKGTSEDYWIDQKLASIKILQPDLIALKSTKNLLGQLLLLKQWMLERSPITDSDADEWLQSAIDKYFPVQKIEDTYLLQLPNSSMTLDYKKPMQSSAVIYSNPSDIKIVWET